MKIVLKTHVKGKKKMKTLSMAHPNEDFLPEEEAQFVINSARIILRYIDSKMNRASLTE
ncbi:hypothetical protein [Bacillus niameyensis]|uniref:hypothetical protein n=1 Tax=Bacillus niameyensis TaxID=1522308 RepID=UPI001E5E37B0|nr:hypothetical protein [Bacillus niameyensis]